MEAGGLRRSSHVRRFVPPPAAQQWRDVLGVIKLQGPGLDAPYLREWAATLGVADLLERAVDEGR